MVGSGGAVVGRWWAIKPSWIHGDAGSVQSPCRACVGPYLYTDLYGSFDSGFVDETTSCDVDLNCVHVKFRDFLRAERRERHTLRM